MTIQIVTAERKDVDDFFKLSDVFTAERLNHTPMIVFIATEDAVQVRLLDHARDLLSLPDETAVMGQWCGQCAMTSLNSPLRSTALRGGGTCAAEERQTSDQSRRTAGWNQATQLRVRR